MSFLAILSVVNADISHLTGYQYPSQANHHGTASLKLHSVESPASTQYFATYGNGKSKLPNSYVPPASGSPFESSVPLPKTYTPQPPSQVSQPPTAAPFQQQRSLFNYQTQPSVSPYNFQQYQQQQQYQQPASVYQPIRSNYNQPSTTYNQVRTSQEPIVTKHFYVHAAPEDPEDDIGPRFIPVGPPRKTYKIIFIKTPTYGLRSQIIPIPPQTEEKTIVYVLSKKPTFDQNVQLPQPTTTEPTKPEVFFVKYKTQEEADRAQKEIQGKVINIKYCTTIYH